MLVWDGCARHPLILFKLIRYKHTRACVCVLWCSGFRPNKVYVVRHHTRWLSVFLFSVHVQVCHIRKSDSEAENDYDARTILYIYIYISPRDVWFAMMFGVLISEYMAMSQQSVLRPILSLSRLLCANEWFFFLQFSFYIFSIETDHIARYGKMSERAARQKFWQILSAVEYCHNRGIVHRDLKVKLKRERESEWFNYFNQIPGSTSIRKHLTFV